MRGSIRLLALIVIVGAIGAMAFALDQVGNAHGYAPEQPIAFSHELHAGENEIQCLYCHFGAEKSRHAGIPPSSVCMNCHEQLKIESRDIARLKESVAQKRPIAWVRVHDLPDFVAFSHARHVRVAALTCETCHGPVASMARLRQHAPLTMGWCIDCHRERGATSLVDRAELGVPADRAIGGLDCSKCHY